ncbi:hypothetical protein O181_132808 [Austropuccinia psidii MF-1]|uniref:Uncharacterized protein n=1 Tax=Austropuccinia psidii MF-1 TaxID=1389203 RepID=A0A9Q3L4I4_9BASI|nr:hypothetical protein [Austropuccinia psidii MF-1]
MEDATVAPHSLRSVPTNFDVSSEPELIKGNILRDEPFPSGSHRYISVPVQKLVQNSQGTRVGNMPKPLAGGHELLLTHKEISGSGEDHGTLGRVDSIVLQRQDQKDKELVEKPKPFIHRSEEGVGNDPSFGERRPSGVYQLQKSSRNVKRQAKRSLEPSGQWKRQIQLAQILPTRLQDPQIGTFSSGKCCQYGPNSYGNHIQRAGKDEQDFSMQRIDEIQFVKYSMDVQLGRFDVKLKKKTDINELKKND